MPLHVKDNGAWKTPRDVYVKDSSTWKQCKYIYIKDAGVWKPLHITATISSSTSNVNLFTLAGSPIYPVSFIVTVNSGVSISSSSTSTAALDVGSFPTGSKVVLINNGTIYGAGGAKGSYGGGGTEPNTTWAVGNPPTTLSSATSSFVNGTYPNIVGNYSGARYYQGIGVGANWPDYNYYSGGTGPSNGGPGGNGGPAINLSNNVRLIIYNNSTGLIVGGGGGGGGQAGNNRGGGAGGNGGYAIVQSGSHPDIILYNESGGVLASGGGGAGGWGNRYEGEGHGGNWGQSGYGIHWTGAGSTGGISPGVANNNTGTTIINTAGTFTVSPGI